MGFKSSYKGVGREKGFQEAKYVAYQILYHINIIYLLEYINLSVYNINTSSFDKEGIIFFVKCFSHIHTYYTKLLFIMW